MTILAVLIAALPGLAYFLTVHATNAQSQTAAQGQITSSFNTAVANIGSPSIDVRVGGIYGLQHLMQDTPSYQPTVISVLCAFVRNQTSLAVRHGPLISPLPTDVQAALNVIGMRNIAKDGKRSLVNLEDAQLPTAYFKMLYFAQADLRWANLSRAYLAHAHFRKANLLGAKLAGATLTDVYLEGADLENANLSGAYGIGPRMFGTNLAGANLTGADFIGARLMHADLSRANLTLMNLTNANLTNADLRGANLNGADLNGANFTNVNLTDTNLTGENVTTANLSGANLTGAAWSASIAPPAGWVRDPGSGQLRRVSPVVTALG